MWDILWFRRELEMLALLGDDSEDDDLILLQLQSIEDDSREELLEAKHLVGQFNLDDKSNDWTIKNCR